MKDKFQSLKGMRLRGRSMNGPEITRKSRGNHAVITRFSRLITSTLLLLFTFAIGNVWAATFALENNPATKKYGDITFLDVANTKANGKITADGATFKGDSTLAYSLRYVGQTLAITTWYNCSDGSPASNFESSPTYADAVINGFVAPSSTSGNVGYGGAKAHSSRIRYFYATGITSVAIISHDNQASKYVQLKIEEVAENGTLSAVATIDSPNKSSSTLSLIEYTTSLNPAKYYKISCTSNNTSNCKVYQIRFGKYIAPATKYTVTYKAGDGTGDDVVDSDAKTVKAFADCSFTAPSGYEFKEWQDGSSNVVAAGASVSDNMTLTAIYRLIPTKYTVEYILNGPSGDAPTETSKAKDDVFTLAAAPSWAGHAFDGWLCSADAAVKVAGSSYTMTAANTTFTAQWHEVDCKIYSWTGEIGTAEVTSDGNASIADGKLILSGSAGRIKLTPASGTFKAGDVVTVSGYTGNASKKFGVYVKNAAGSSNIATAEETTLGDGFATATLSADADYVFLARKESTTMNVLTCEIHRACAEGVAAGLAYATTEVAKTEGDAAFTNPLTNANGLVIAGYKSSNTAVATVATNGQVTVVGPGSATITANSAVQTKAGTLYAAGTASYTLTVAALPKYHVTYDLNGGSGDVAEVDHKAGEKFTLHDGVTGVTAPGSKTFVNWKDQDDALFDGGVEYTMPAKDVTLTAQWAGDVYTVKFMDGETVLDTKVVEVGSHPTDIEHPTKPLFTFAAWQLSGSDVNLDEVSGTKDAIVTLTARWAKAYASNADFEAYIIANKSEKDDADKAEAYVKSLNYALSTKTGTTFDANDETNNGAYAGLKIKNAGTVLSWNVVPGKVVELKAGVMVANGSLAINSGTPATIDGGSTTSGNDNYKIHYFYSATEALYEFTTSNGSAEVIKAITMRDPYTVSFEAHGDADPSALPGQPSVTLPAATNGTASLLGWFDAETGGNKIGDAGDSYTPTANITLHAQWEAISTDARLASITFSSAAGTLEPAFDPEVVNYTYTMPYPTAAVPTITGATAVNANAKAPVIDAQAANWGDVAHIHGVAQSDDTKDYYITMQIAPKDGISIIKVATTGGTNKTVTGLYAGDGDVNLSSSKKMDNGKYIGFTLDGTTLQAGDRINVHTTQAANTGGSHIIFYDNMTNKTELYETGEIGGLGDNIFTINAAMVGSATAYVYRANNDVAHQWNGYVDYIEVLRAMNPVLTAITFDGEAATKGTGNTYSVTLPSATTDLANMTIVPTIIRNAAHATTPEAVITNSGDWVEGANTYRVMDKDGDYTDYTINITLQGAAETPVITAQPASQAYCAGGEPTLTVAANNPSDGGTLHYAWFKEAGATDEAVGTDAASYTIEAAGTYYVIVTNRKDGSLDASATSDNAVVTLNVAAEITTQPTNKTDIVSGSSVTLSVVASNATSYQWYSCDDAEKHNAVAIVGADEADYIFTCTANGYYYCAIGNACGDAILSTVASVKLEPIGCNLLDGTIPSAAPYIYDNSEWTIYAVTSAGKLDGSSRFVDNAKDFNDNTVNAITYGRVGMTFATDIESLTIYATSSSTGRTFQSISVTEDDVTTGTPSYSAIAADLAVATMPGQNKQYVFTADNMLLEAGKKYWLQFNGTVTIFKICYTAAAEKCAAPVLPALADKELCEGEAFTAWDATSTKSDAGTLSYQWYNGDTDAAIDGATNASFTPSADGNYYVIVTNKLTGYRDNSTKSATLSVEHFAAAEITTAPAIQRKEAGQLATLTVVATGKAPLTYQWYTCDDEAGSNPIIIEGADEATYEVTVTVGMSQYYKVVVGSGCGSAEAVTLVEEWHEVAPANVTGSRTWDWAAENMGTIETVSGSTEYLMANVSSQVPNTEAFRSDMLYITANYANRSASNKFFQGWQIRFYTEVPGKVSLNCRAIHGTMSVTINGTVIDAAKGSDMGNATTPFFVPAGWVTIAFDNQSSGYEGEAARVQKIVFNTTPDYTRDVTEGRYGTICLPNGGVMVGAALYEVAYYGETSQKIFFDEILGGTMVAGVPYIFLPKDGVSTIGVYYTDAENAEAGSANGLIGFIGADAEAWTQVPDDEECYILQNNQYRKVLAGADARIKSNRAYIKLGNINRKEPALSPGRKRISFSIEGSQVATGMENINADETPKKVMINGELFILRGEKMYNVNGQIVK